MIGKISSQVNTDQDLFLEALDKDIGFRDKVVSKALDVLSQSGVLRNPLSLLLTRSIAPIAQNTLLNHQLASIHLVAILQLCAQSHSALVAFHIDKIDLLDEGERIKLAEACAKRNGAVTAECIKRFRIASTEALIKIAKLCAAQDGGGTAKCIKNFRIQDKQSLIEIVKLCARQNGGDTAFCIHNFGIEDKQVLIEIARLCAQENGAATAKYIHKFEIKDKQVLLEIAYLCADQNGGGTACHIHNFGVQDRAERIKLAKLCAKHNGERTAQFIDNFHIQDLASFIEIIKLCLPLSSARWKILVNDYPQIVSALHPLFILGLLSTDETREAVKQFQSLNVLQECQKLYLPAPLILQFLEQERVKCESELPSSALFLRYARHALMALYVAKECERIGLRELGSCEPFLMAIFKLRGTDVPWKELMELDSALHDSDLRSRLQGQNVNAHEQLIYLNYVVGSKDSSADQFVSGWEQLKKKEGPLLALRHDLKQKDSGLLQQLLLTTTLLNKIPAVSSEQRYGLIWSGWTTPLELADRLRYLQILLQQGVFKKGVCASWQLPISNERLKQHLISVAEQLLFQGEVSSEERQLFSEKYLEWTTTQRKSFALEAYALKMRSLNDPLINHTLRLLVLYLLRGTFSKERYAAVNPHLAALARDHSTLWSAWQKLPPLTDYIPQQELRLATIDWGEESRQWLHAALVQNQHVPKDQLLALRSFLQNGEVVSAPSAIEALCQGLCQKEISKQDTEKKLQELSRLIKEDVHLKDAQWARDIEDRLKILAASEKSAASLRIGITDEWNDLFLSGTEVVGSCQEIDTVPSWNKCLLSYCMDGKMQLAVIKEKESGRIQARALIKLLFKKDASGTAVPVLFFEQAYSAPGFPNSEAALRSIAIERAKRLGIEVYEKGEQERLYSFGTSAPYEYEDAGGGVTKQGIYTIAGSRIQSPEVSS